MKQVVVRGPGAASVVEIDAPEPGPRDIVVEMRACGICGSDLTYIKMGGFCITGGPMPLGHEIAGIVEWVGAEVRDTNVGDRVAVYPGDPNRDGMNIIGNGGAEGGLTNQLLVKDAARGRRVFRVPDELSLEVAALVEPTAVGMKAAGRTNAARGDQVAVFGCGPIGLAAIAALVDRGVDVVGIDLSARRLELAGGLGAQAVLNPAKVDVWEELSRIHGKQDGERTPSPATQAFIEASGSGLVAADIVNHARVGSRVTVVALHMAPVELSLLSVMSKELEIVGSMGYPERYEDAIELLGRQDLSNIITHRIPLDRFGEALEVLSGDKDCGKVLITNGTD